jgi:hypothetical protein
VHEAEKEEVLLNSLENEFKQKMKSASDEATREKLKDLLSNIKKEISEIFEGKVLNEIQYHHYSLKYGTCFDASIGAEAIYQLFKNLDLKKAQRYY